MKENQLIKFNKSLIATAVLTIFISVLMLIADGQPLWGVPFVIWVWIHIIMCMFCLTAVLYHLHIHWGPCNAWVTRIRHLHAKNNTILVWLSSGTFLMGIITAIMYFLPTDSHIIGKIHGKFALLWILFVLFHVLKRLKWFRGRSKGEVFVPKIDARKCVFCQKCSQQCPAEVFEVDKANRRIIVKDKDFCLQCKKCVKICPKGAI